jgi:NSS family neurotransmitter:Na+ symporter
MYGRGFFETLDYVTGNWMLLLSALFTTLFIGWVMQRQTIYEEFLKGSKLGKIMPIWFFMIRWLAPIAILLIVLEEAKLIDINLFSNYCRIPSK